jgi:hypothetical protein
LISRLRGDWSRVDDDPTGEDTSSSARSKTIGLMLDGQRVTRLIPYRSCQMGWKDLAPVSAEQDAAAKQAAQGLQSPGEE